MDITPGDGFGRSILPKLPDPQALFPLPGGSLLKFRQFFFYSIASGRPQQ